MGPRCRAVVGPLLAGFPGGCPHGQVLLLEPWQYGGSARHHQQTLTGESISHCNPQRKETQFLHMVTLKCLPWDDFLRVFRLFPEIPFPITNLIMLSKQHHFHFSLGNPENPHVCCLNIVL